MTSFHEFLRAQIATDGFTTEDVLVAFLPLMRQVIAAHEVGRVAPLEGLHHLRMDGRAIGFPEAERPKPRRNLRQVSRMQNITSGGVDVVNERRVTFDVNDGIERQADLLLGSADDDLRRPVYLPGYLCWEHLVDHHDPTTDVFSLGLILASLACSRDFTEPDDHERFVRNRRNLFRLHAAIHPVLARAILLMTELDRHQRPQDLPALMTTLENYRDHEVDFETDLHSDQTLQGADRRGKRQVILSKLQERLFEINRRNRLLQFRTTMQTTNLTQASIPLSFDPGHIRDDQVLTWGGDFAKRLRQQKPVSLNRLLNFREAVYLPGQLDRMRVEARRDETEYGFAQLRIIICFLRWADLKAQPPERYESPLLLIPVKLDVKKGIHDRYSVTATDDIAEVNPLIRHLFRQLYNIALPETVDLKSGDVDAFFEHLKSQIQASDNSVSLTCIRKPRIELIHEKARRRLDQFRRRARLAGRGIRQFLDLDYSYDPINYHPLGVRIFEDIITPGKTHLEGIVSTQASERRYMVESAESSDTVEVEQSFYNLQSEADDNPFSWEFDLCSVTLANLKYRRMSLVRDYSHLVADNTPNAAFEETFSITPVEVVPQASHPQPLEERYHVVACDSTQAEAITHAKAGGSYIIQGPPGTGKSQTITNLIADFVMRGRRVLFVCEKRAAIDVVYHRLKQLGLHDLCCLIHDSQADKKQFVMDLKETYDTFLAEAARARDETNQRRTEVIERIRRGLEPVAAFAEAMNTATQKGGPSFRTVLDRLLVLRDHVPTLVPREWERVPDYAEFSRHQRELEEFADRLQHVQPDLVLSKHPLGLLSARITDAEHPVSLVGECLQYCLGEHNDGKLAGIIADLESLGLPSEATSSIEQLQESVRYAVQAGFLADADQLDLLDVNSRTSRTFEQRLKKLARCDRKLAKIRETTAHWKTKLSSEDTRIAMQQAQVLERGLLRFFNPAWWRLRRTLNDAYDFSQHAVRPLWSQVLKQLDQEHDQLADRYDLADTIRNDFEINIEFDDFHKRLQDFRESHSRQPGPVASLYQHVLSSADGAEKLKSLAALGARLDEMCSTLNRCLDGYLHRPLPELHTTLVRVSEALDQLPDFLHCLKSLQPLPDRTTAAIRTLPLSLLQLEAAAAEQSLQQLYREDRQVARYDNDVRTKQIQDVATACDQWMKVNAETIRESVRQRFNDHVTTASLPAARLTSEQKEFKTSYNRGRRALEHEFGKSMRYKAIRELAAGESGRVVRDLKPVWLMSPLSVSDTLPLHADNFDVVIFDEASQITLEEAIPSLFRAEQTIVVGDEMQLPPTSFFSSRRIDDDDDLAFEEEGETVQYDLNSSSFLNHSSRNLPSRMLGWHYRSRSESLISFSNHAFYRGRLLTVPEERLASGSQAELVATAAEDGSQYAPELLRRAVSFHFCDHGVYEKRRNTAEARYIAELVRALLLSDSPYSIGIIAFSEAQQGEIDSALKQLAATDAEFSDVLEAELEREEDGQFMGLLVKNLENIQGDERDIIIMSVCYGPDPENRTRMNFGPINQAGGEKRLNVAFSRARHCMALVASMRSTAITNEYNDGANCLKNYLKYAEACSTGQKGTVRAVLESLSGNGDDDADFEAAANPLVDELEAALTDRGYCVDRGVGQSHFRCDMAVYREGDDEYRLGILTDGSTWYQQQDLLERELMKPQLLEAFGWAIEVILARDWYHQRAEVLQRLEQRLLQE